MEPFVHTMGAALRARHGERVHKLAIDAGFTCPNRDGSRGTGGCTFCNNASFNPSRQSGRRARSSIAAQIAAGRAVIARRTGAKRFLAYFQAYSNTYDEVDALAEAYDEALAEPDVIGLSIGTRPDCVSNAALDLIASYRDRGREVWLELGLQSSYDATLDRVNRGHGYGEYRDTVRAARARGIPVCTHLILGLPGEAPAHVYETLRRVLDEGVDGLKLHPLHVVRGTRLAESWRAGDVALWSEAQYIDTVVNIVAMTPRSVVFHRLHGTAGPDVLLAPAYCGRKWSVLNAIVAQLRCRGLRQGCGLQVPAGDPTLLLAEHAAQDNAIDVRDGISD